MSYLELMFEILLSLKLCEECRGTGELMVPTLGAPGGVETPECDCRIRARARFHKIGGDQS